MSIQKGRVRQWHYLCLFPTSSSVSRKERNRTIWLTLLVVAQQMGISEEKIHESLKASQQPMSLETPRNEENDHDLGDVLEDQMAASPTDIIAHHQLQEYVADALARL